MGPTAAPGQSTTLPYVFTAETLHDPASGAWNMDTGASSHLNNSVNSLSENYNTCMYPSISVGDEHSIPITNTGHSILPTPPKSLHLNIVLITPHIVKNLIYVRQFVRYNNCTIEFDAFRFSIKDFMARRGLLRCDSTRDLYPVTAPSPIPHAFLLGKYMRLPFVSSGTMISSCFNIIHLDVWTPPIISLMILDPLLSQPRPDVIVIFLTPSPDGLRRRRFMPATLSPRIVCMILQEIWCSWGYDAVRSNPDAVSRL
nr:ribonuclease H-like domain-containing protein [Tanacetum cinerariifolium]